MRLNKFSADIYRFGSAMPRQYGAGYRHAFGAEWRAYAKLKACSAAAPLVFLSVSAKEKRAQPGEDQKPDCTIFDPTAPHRCRKLELKAAEHFKTAKKYSALGGVRRRFQFGGHPALREQLTASGAEVLVFAWPEPKAGGGAARPSGPRGPIAGRGTRLRPTARTPAGRRRSGPLTRSPRSSWATGTPIEARAASDGTREGPGPPKKSEAQRKKRRGQKKKNTDRKKARSFLGWHRAWSKKSTFWPRTVVFSRADPDPFFACSPAKQTKQTKRRHI